MCQAIGPAVVVPGLDQLLAQRDDGVLNIGTDASRIAAWVARARLDRSQGGVL
jgi:hypothetical protein